MLLPLTLCTTSGSTGSPFLGLTCERGGCELVVSTVFPGPGCGSLALSGDL